MEFIGDWYPFWMSRYEQLKNEASGFYSQIRKIPCPALNNEEVLFNDTGFNHLLRKGNTPRSKSDQLRRFRLLKHVSAVLQSKTASVSIRENKHVRFWTIADQIGEKIIKVVISQFKGGAKCFFSIMDYHQK